MLGFASLSDYETSVGRKRDDFRARFTEMELFGSGSWRDNLDFFLVLRELGIGTRENIALTKIS